jgi:cbb3-type cytochrome oxidase maturation protein
MTVMYVMIFVSFTIAVFFLFAFIWAVKSGQFKDRTTPAIRVLFDDIKEDSSDMEEVNARN